MKLTHKKNENHDVNLKAAAILIFFQQIIFCIYGKTRAAVELILATLLGSMALACQDMYDVEIDDGVIVPVSHFHIILARSGSRKTTVYRLTMAQIHQLERELAEMFSVRLKEYEWQYVLWDEECKSLKKSLQKAVRQKEGVEKARNELEECLKNEPIKPVRVRLTVTDPTPEALLNELSEYSSLGITSDEGSALYESIMRRKTAIPNTLWCGDDYRVSRVSTGSTDIKDPRLGMLLMMQPEPHDSTLKSLGNTIRATGSYARTLTMDLTLLTRVIDIDELVSGDESDLEKFYAIQKKHLLAGIERREKNQPRICMTFAPDARKRLRDVGRDVKHLMQPGKKLYHYNDWGARFIEHTARIAAVMQLFITPDLTVITLETLEAALLISEWHLNHFIAKLDAVRGPSHSERVLRWLEDHLVKNGSYDFLRRDIMQDIHRSLRKKADLEPVLEQLAEEGKVQLWEDDNGTHYVKYLAYEMTPSELDAKLNILSGRPAYHSGGSVFSSIPLKE
ncbi:YfjI family protein [Klebsiella oxytoca]|uniref:YfjI family protein n=1 Tax=Klebsiella oxytoca TaxID=571 RepID=UPI0035715C8C